ncbi:hypothetical protein KKG65_00505 [Patescibacteria group bacterium]|nr:hypothetical protein [Patescibacteria group bacterium]
MSESRLENQPGEVNLIVLRDDEGKVRAVGTTQEEAEARMKKLGETPMDSQDPHRTADGPSPDWIEARAGSLGLTLEQYQGLAGQGVEDIGELVATYGVEGAIKTIEAGKDLKEGEIVHEEVGKAFGERGSNQQKRIEMAVHAMKKGEKMLKDVAGGHISVDSGDRGVMGINPEQYGDEGLTEEEEERYQEMLDERKREEEEKERNKILNKARLGIL